MSMMSMMSMQLMQHAARSPLTTEIANPSSCDYNKR
jgi:hypothetical protein